LSKRLGRSWVKALIDTKGFRISWTMPEAIASRKARRSAHRRSLSNSLRREKVAKDGYGARERALR